MSRIIAAITAFTVALTIAVSAAQAQTRIDAEVPAATYNFGEHITFHLEASAPNTIQEVNLFFRVQGHPDTVVVPVPIEAASTLDIDLRYQPAEHHILPFSTITYWWEMVDENREQQLTEEQLLYYADNRYAWRPVKDQRNGVTWEVYSAQGDVASGQTALDTAVKSLDEIYQQFQTSAPGVIRIFVYPSEDDLRSALNLVGYDWAGGQARPELGAILVGIPEGPAALGEMERKIPHELTHLLVYEAAGRTLGRVPPWLNEGLASLNEGRPDPNRQALVEQALEGNQLFPLEALCAPFPTDANAARLAYAQSASLVEYLREEYGGQVIRDLLATYADDVSCEAGVTQVLGKDFDSLDAAWRTHLQNRARVTLALNDGTLWLALWLLTAMVALPLLGVLGTRRD